MTCWIRGSCVFDEDDCGSTWLAGGEGDRLATIPFQEDVEVCEPKSFQGFVRYFSHLCVVYGVWLRHVGIFEGLLQSAAATLKHVNDRDSV